MVVMKIRIFLMKQTLCCLFLLIIGLAVVSLAYSNTFGNDTGYESGQLDVALSFHNPQIGINDSVVFDIKLINKGKEKLTVVNRLELGYFSGVLLVANDETGKTVFSEIYYCLPPPPPLETSRYISLFPDHYLGATLDDTAANLFVRPGKYSVFAVYVGPVYGSSAKEYVGINNLWGRERVPIISSTVWIEVTGDKSESK